MNETCIFRTLKYIILICTNVSLTKKLPETELKIEHGKTLVTFEIDSSSVPTIDRMEGVSIELM